MCARVCLGSDGSTRFVCSTSELLKRSLPTTHNTTEAGAEGHLPYLLRD